MKIINYPRVGPLSYLSLYPQHLQNTQHTEGGGTRCAHYGAQSALNHSC